ncbi:DUF6115 domain-containing protein [Paenibacillus sp. SYP-B4298]|uniref:DUF6115 domain-containing protein n=1 Tax=Paenibacillus sp. SYP-B4298 TaxID=2996034 RepID=UPI0022DD54F8|nr:hypothetical protein [Paenibacillus sp. SYP-B4298]
MDQPWHYLVLLGAFVIVLSFAMPKRSRPSAPVGDMELALEQFMQSIEEENKELANIVGAAQREQKEALSSSEQRIAALEKRSEELQRRYVELEQQLGEQIKLHQAEVAAKLSELGSRQQVHADTGAASPLPAEEEMPVSDRISDRYADLLAMHHQGKSMEYIAKKLGLNKGEVQLIVQLSAQEERHRA